MELKLETITIITNIQSGLLIVPYGIETGLSFTSHNSKLLLLIVPYGIETRYECTQIIRHAETFNRTLWN